MQYGHDNETVSKWLDRIFKSEGGFTDNPSDRGNWTSGQIGVGECNGTKYGISAMSYPFIDIESLTRSEAADIYTEDYLMPLRAYNYPDALTFQLFDFAINSGPATALKQLQKAVGATPDGIIGPNSLLAINKFSQSELVMMLIGQRLDYFASIKTFDTFGRGWIRRMADNCRYAAEDIA